MRVDARKLLAVIVVAALAAAGGRAQTPVDPEMRCRELIEELLAAGDAVAAKAKIKEIEGLGLGLESVTKLLRGMRIRPRPETGTIEREMTLGPAGERFKVLLFVPLAYDPGSRWPLWITLHGTGGRAEDPFRSMIAQARRRGVILASLEEHPSRHGKGWGYTDVERDVHADLVRVLSRELQIDPDRVYVNGWSRGGHGSWDLGLRYPDMFAGIGPIIGAVRQRDLSRVPSLRNVRVDAVNGAKDQPALVLGVTEAVSRMRSRGYDVRHLLDPRRGHDGFGERIAPMVDYLLDDRRDPRPPRVTIATWRKDVNRAFWVTITKLGTKGLYVPGKRIVIKGSSSMNEAERRHAWLAHIEEGTAFVDAVVESRKRIDVTTHLVKRIELRLHPELVDLEGKIEIIVNGRSKSVRPRPSVRTLLETAYEARDPGLAAPARLSLPVR